MEMKEGLKSEMRQISDETAKYITDLPPEWVHTINTFDCMGDMPGYPKVFGYVGIFNVVRDAIGAAVQMGVDSWRRDTFEYFGTWDDCWSRVTGALVDENGEEFAKTVTVQKYKRVEGILKIKAFIWKYV